MRAFKIYPFSLAAGASQTLLAEGSYFRVKTSTGDVTITFDDNAAFGPISAGQGQRRPYKRLTINDASGAANIGTVIVADDSFVDDRITGEVSVIDGGKGRTLAGSAFYGFTYLGAIGGQYAHAQLWNPAASGKNLMLGQVYPYGSVAAAGYILSTTQTALGTLNGNPLNKKFSGAVSAAELRTNSNVAQLGTTIGSILRGVPLKLTEPMVIPPGWGLMVHAASGEECGANFEFFEESA